METISDLQINQEFSVIGWMKDKILKVIELPNIENVYRIITDSEGVGRISGIGVLAICRDGNLYVFPPSTAVQKKNKNRF